MCGKHVFGGFGDSGRRLAAEDIPSLPLPRQHSITLVIYGEVTAIIRFGRMTLSAMVVSRDWREISVLECILGGLHMDVSVETEPANAWHKLCHSKIDALIVDCDLEGSPQMLDRLQDSGRQFNTVPLVIMGEPRGMATLDEAILGDAGTLFAFEKPISVEQAVRTLSAARSMILEGRLRYHRVGIQLPVSLDAGKESIKSAQVINLSQGGMRIYADRAIDAANLQVSCELPGTQSALRAQAEVVWHDGQGNIGIRFIDIPDQQQRTLELWVARQFLMN